MKKQKRMIYIYEENLEFYEGLANKSQWINDKLQDARIDNRIKPEPGEDPRITGIKDQLKNAGL